MIPRPEGRSEPAAAPRGPRNFQGLLQTFRIPAGFLRRAIKVTSRANYALSAAPSGVTYTRLLWEIDSHRFVESGRIRSTVEAIGFSMLADPILLPRFLFYFLSRTLFCTLYNFYAIRIHLYP